MCGRRLPFSRWRILPHNFARHTGGRRTRRARKCSAKLRRRRIWRAPLRASSRMPRCNFLRPPARFPFDLSRRARSRHRHLLRARPDRPALSLAGAQGLGPSAFCFRSEHPISHPLFSRGPVSCGRPFFVGARSFANGETRRHGRQQGVGAPNGIEHANQEGPYHDPQDRHF